MHMYNSYKFLKIRKPFVNIPLCYFLIVVVKALTEMLTQLLQVTRPLQYHGFLIMDLLEALQRRK